MTLTQLPDSRRAQILDWLREHKRAAIDALAEHFDVSSMTIHRDVAELTKTGEVRKIHGGVVLVEAASVSASAEARCEMCGVSATRMPWLLRTGDGQTHTACCPHCGLMMLAHTPEISMALTTDFLYGRTVSAKSAFYVVGSSVQTCCAPSVLSFCCAEDAERFVRGFGGEALGFDAAAAMLHHM
jgi:DeoR/GlpR family transcriptional regulator of sugar metabolism